jgi:hypothetical protein
MDTEDAVRGLARLKTWPWEALGRVLALVVIIVLAIFIYRQIFVVPGELRQVAEDAKIDTRAAQGQVTVTTETLERMQERGRDREVVREIVRENERVIRNAPGASDPVPAAVHRAVIDSIRQLRQQADQRERPADRLPKAGPRGTPVSP